MDAAMHAILDISFEKLSSFWEEAQNCLDVDDPEPVDYRKLENPHLAKFGQENWETRISKSKTLSDYCCITDLVTHIAEEIWEAFVSTNNKDGWVFYYEALSWMTAKYTIAWMRKKDYYRRWILPFNNLQREPDLKAYDDRPAVDSTENMPWDCSLNQDVHLSTDLHVTMANNTVKDEDGRFPEGKFDISTPNRGAHDYCRTLHLETGGVPSIKRIIWDIEKVFESMEMVRKSEGIKIDSLGNQKGKF